MVERATPHGRSSMLSAVTWVLSFTMGLVPRPAPLTAAVLDAPTRHVRTTDRPIRALLEAGFRQSPTVATLIARLERSDLIVYVQQVDRLPNALEGRLLMLPSAHGVRYVRIQIALQASPSASIALIGHELRHAVEVAEAPSVVDQPGLAALYRRIGVEHGHNVFDTIEAQEIGRRVLKELAA
jgi:hypothetical protein